MGLSAYSGKPPCCFPSGSRWCSSRWLSPWSWRLREGALCRPTHALSSSRAETEALRRDNASLCKKVEEIEQSTQAFNDHLQVQHDQLAAKMQEWMNLHMEVGSGSTSHRPDSEHTSPI